jgi:hypothetical protein
MSNVSGARNAYEKAMRGCSSTTPPPSTSANVHPTRLTPDSLSVSLKYVKLPHRATQTGQ